jgi:hypothetical protein
MLLFGYFAELILLVAKVHFAKFAKCEQCSIAKFMLPSHHSQATRNFFNSWAILEGLNLILDYITGESITVTGEKNEPQEWQVFFFPIIESCSNCVTQHNP